MNMSGSCSVRSTGFDRSIVQDEDLAALKDFERFLAVSWYTVTRFWLGSIPTRTSKVSEKFDLTLC